MKTFDYKKYIADNRSTVNSKLSTKKPKKPKKLLEEINPSTRSKALDVNGTPINLGSKVKALQDLDYMMGQIESDMIEKGQVCTVDGISNNGDLFFKEHADRYGPWPSNAFVLVKKIKEAETDEFATDDFEKEPSKKDLKSTSNSLSGNSKKRTLLSKLTAQKNELLQKLKSGSITIDQYKQQIETIPQQIKTLTADLSQMLKPDEDEELDEELGNTNTPVDWDEFFEKYHDEDINGPSTEIAIDNLIDEVTEMLSKIPEQDRTPGKIAIKQLWVEKIRRWR